MKYFLVYITLFYDGYEWTSQAVFAARNEQSARRKAEKNDYTHDNGIEEQRVSFVKEIPFEHYQVLQHYL